MALEGVLRSNNPMAGVGHRHTEKEIAMRSNNLMAETSRKHTNPKTSWPSTTASQPHTTNEATTMSQTIDTNLPRH
jgi:hypothetical protein